MAMASPLAAHAAPTGQEDENGVARAVVVCGPTQGKMMGGLHPAGSLYEKPINLNTITEQHANFRKVLESNDVAVHDVADVLGRDTERSIGARIELENLAMMTLTYTYERGAGIVDEAGEGGVADSDYYVSDEYKRTVVEAMSKSQLVDVVLTNPTVTVKRSYRDTGFTASYAFEPLSNIIFTRDQQITTRKGIVMSRLRSEQRKKEIVVMEFVLKKLGLAVIGRIPGPGYLEGGDFFPAGPDLCFCGVGPRSTIEAVHYMMENDLLGTRRVAVVKDELEKSQDRMHLDTCFNIISPKCCVMLDEMMGMSSATRRMVDEYAVGEGEGKKYTRLRSDVEFSQYLIDNQYDILPIPAAEQLQYGCNALNLGGGRLLAVHKPSARRIARHPNFSGSVEHLDFNGITSMYGAVHW